MSTSVLLVPALLAIFFVYKNRRWASLLLLGISVGLSVFMGGGTVAQWALDDLQAAPYLEHPAWGARNVMVLLGGGTMRWPSTELLTSHPLARSRLMEAARLYQDCKKKAPICLVLTTGGDPGEHGQAEAEVMARELREVGVAESDILLETKSKNTFQNAQFSSEIIVRENFDEVFLVTSGFHMKRAMLYFNHFLKFRPTLAPAEKFSAITSILPLSFNFSILDLAVHEYSGLILYRVYNFLGINPGNDQPGAP